MGVLLGRPRNHLLVGLLCGLVGPLSVSVRGTRRNVHLRGHLLHVSISSDVDDVVRGSQTAANFDGVGDQALSLITQS